MVGETCAVLLPYIPNALISSLVFSILQQLALEDKDIQVRQCAISRFVSCSIFMNSNKNEERSTLKQCLCFLHNFVSTNFSADFQTNFSLHQEKKVMKN